MIKFLAGGIVVWIAAHGGQALAQFDAGKSIETLHEQGKRELAPNWHSLGITHKAAVFLHNDVRKADNGQLAVWMHQELPSAEYLEKEKRYVSTRDRLLVDCKGSRLGTTDQAYYAEHFARGAVVGMVRNKNVEMQETVPDSIEELLVKTICAPKPKPAPAAKPKAKTKTKAEPKPAIDRPRPT